MKIWWGWRLAFDCTLLYAFLHYFSLCKYTDYYTECVCPMIGDKFWLFRPRYFIFPTAQPPRQLLLIKLPKTDHVCVCANFHSVDPTIFWRHAKMEPVRWTQRRRQFLNNPYFSAPNEWKNTYDKNYNVVNKF